MTIDYRYGLKIFATCLLSHQAQLRGQLRRVRDIAHWCGHTHRLFDCALFAFAV